ncbi:MAG: hypothetical protein Q9159_004044 [Coniocarpon cinnabarinum]
MPMRDPMLSDKGIGKPGAEPSSDLRSPEDNVTLWQWWSVAWIGRLLARAGKRQLNEEDVWFLGHEFQHRLLHDKFRQLKGSVTRRLLVANGLDLMVLIFITLTDEVAYFSIPVLLQQLLRAWEDGNAGKASVVNVLFLWFGRRAYERSRGEMITMLYEKTLSRKIITTKENDEKSNADGAHGSAHEDGSEESQKQKLSLWRRTVDSMTAYFSGPISWLKRRFGVEKATEAQKKPASMGKILNLMRNDAYEVAQRFWEFDRIFSTPVGIVVATALIWNLIGPSCLLGVVTIVVVQVVNVFFSKLLLHWERKRRSATDERLHVTSQTIESIRHLRWYGWQQTWIDKIMDKRQRELNLKIVTSIWNISLGFMNILASGAFPVVAFSAYTALAGQPLRIDIAFPALQLFSLLEDYLRDLPGLIAVMLNAMVAMSRIEDFMNEEDKAEIEDKPVSSDELSLHGASFAWPGTSKSVLHDLNLSITSGFIVICGKVGTGKTALLQSLLGELDLLQGQLDRPKEMIAYCEQTPWLESMSIRDNILFEAPFEETRYKQVLDVCALTPDLASFTHGDLSNIGENGIGLSGGQKARVALARAIYSRANILLLDDPISALDHDTAESIVRKAFAGPLLKDRTVVLVTHRTELCVHLANKIIEIVDGTAKEISHAAALAKGLQTSVDTDKETDFNDQEDQAKKEEQEAAAVPDKFIEDEQRASGGVKASVYWQYIKAGTMRWWILNVIGLTLYRVLVVGNKWLLKEWGESYEKDPNARSGLFASFPSPEVNLRPWLLAFFLFVVAYSLAFIFSQIVMTAIVYTTGKRLFNAVIDRVTHATFRFYDVTPVGRLMNRLTSDIGTVDGNIASQFHEVAYQAVQWVTAVVIIASITPAFLVFTAIATGSFVLIFRIFLPTSQNLRRLEMVSLSPLMTNFGALLEGLMTVRAYCAQGRFQARNIAVVDTFQRMDHFYWSVQAWLMYRFDTLAALCTFLLALLALYTDVSAGLAAFVLTAGGNFVNSTHSLCRQYGQIEMDFTSVERVVELLHLEQEPKGNISPPAVWPSTNGDVTFENVTIRYAPHLEPALSDVSFTIKGGSNTAIVGRTGSGKSTLAVSLLATVLPSGGRILIDGIDISKIDPDVLRRRVTFLAQDPLLFEGTIHENLDPLHEHSQDECAAALDRVCDSNSATPSSSRDAPKASSQSNWTLSTRVETGGKNLSQGQRQLVGLARAVLRRSAIIVLDEATASIDLETSMRIQRVLREEMAQSTVLTIAHRVEAVSDVDSAVVLAKGRLVEFRVEDKTHAEAGASAS